MDITSIYQHLQHSQPGRKTSKDIKSLATICKEVLGISLSKVWLLKTFAMFIRVPTEVPILLCDVKF